MVAPITEHEVPADEETTMVVAEAEEAAIIPVGEAEEET